MPIYEYSIDVYCNSKCVCAMSIYVKLSQRAADYGDNLFCEEVNGCGPSGELEQILQRKVTALEVQMTNAIDAHEDAFEGLLEYSFPIEKVSDTPVDKEPDYVYEWFQEGSLTDEELMTQWNSIKQMLGVDTLNVKDRYIERTTQLFPQSVDATVKFLDTGVASSDDVDNLSYVFSDLICDAYEYNEDQKVYALENLHERLHLLV